MKDKTGVSLVGCIIHSKNSRSNATLSGADGEYALRVNPGDKIVFNYIGYTSQEIDASDETTVIILSSDAQVLDEVVVTGYQAARRASVVGSVASVSPTESPAVFEEEVFALVSDEYSPEESVVSESLAMNHMARRTAPAATAASINLKGWEADTPYMNILKDTSDDDLYKTYLILRKGYESAPSFYLDVATLFEQRGLKEEALLILSNLAELKLEDYRLIRVLAHRLSQLKYNDYAIYLFRQVVELRPEEPQSFRDLGLALSQNGEYQEAVETLYKILEKQWDGRFPEIELFAVEEINNIIVRHNKVNITNIDKRIICHMPVDIRIVLNWDTDNSDMDLWVTDPNNERCYYGRTLIKSGGTITRDFTGGYGPEAFLIKKAPKGKYIIQANYYGTREQTLIGPTTVYLDIYTYYGTAKETKKTIMLRLSENKEVVNIGEIVF